MLCRNENSICNEACMRVRETQYSKEETGKLVNPPNMLLSSSITSFPQGTIEHFARTIIRSNCKPHGQSLQYDAKQIQ